MMNRIFILLTTTLSETTTNQTGLESVIDTILTPFRWIIQFFTWVWNWLIYLFDNFYYFIDVIKFLITEVLLIIFSFIKCIIMMIANLFTQNWTNNTAPSGGFSPNGSGMSSLGDLLSNLDLGLWNVDQFVRAGIDHFEQNLDSYSTISVAETQGLGLDGLYNMLYTQMTGVQPLIGSFPDVNYPTNINATLWIGHFRYMVGDTLYLLICMMIIFLVCWMSYGIFDRLFRWIRDMISLIPFV